MFCRKQINAKLSKEVLSYGRNLTGLLMLNMILYAMNRLSSVLRNNQTFHWKSNCYFFLIFFLPNI